MFYLHGMPNRDTSSEPVILDLQSLGHVEVEYTIFWSQSPRFRDLRSQYGVLWKAPSVPNLLSRSADFVMKFRISEYEKCRHISETLPNPGPTSGALAGSLAIR